MKTLESMRVVAKKIGCFGLPMDKYNLCASSVARAAPASSSAMRHLK
ncbi:MAG: hypothetical protein M3Z96_04090 [Pseudomonadota bacterium]|nr:hypothetical protein [Pseudomonadota bacterium]